MLSDYSDLEREMREVPPVKILPRGTEVKLRIIYAQDGEGDYGKWHRLTYDIPAEPAVPEITAFINDPLDAKEDSDVGRRQKTYRKFVSFADCFGVDISRPLNWEDDLISLEGWAILGVKKTDEYGEQNTVSKYVTGQPERRDPVENPEIPF